MNDPVDGLLVQALAELETAKLRVRDLEGFIRVYTELRRSGVQTPALAVPLAPAPISEPAAAVDNRQSDRGTPQQPRPGVVLADPDLSISDAAAKVLRFHGQPMKARRIAETMLAWRYPYPKGVDDLRASVGGVLARAVREGTVFTKLATGLFGLAEWGTDATGGKDKEETLFLETGMVDMD